jgi:hypothetical protein
MTLRWPRESCGGGEPNCLALLALVGWSFVASRGDTTLSSGGALALGKRYLVLSSFYNVNELKLNMLLQGYEYCAPPGILIKLPSSLVASPTSRPTECLVTRSIPQWSSNVD